MAKDKILAAKLKQQDLQNKVTQLKTQKTAQLLQPLFQQQVEIDDEKPLLKIAFKEHLPVENLENILNFKLKSGPYKLSVTPSTTYLAGEGGHIASFNWKHKQLECEFDVKEKCYDIVAIAQRNFAVAQKNSIFIYDPKGTEVHKIRECKQATRLQYLPYHYLLAALNQNGQLTYQDITQGKIISTYRTTPSPLCFELNSHNGILGIGDSMGVVRMYAPNSGTSVTSILCHKGGLTSMAYSRDGFSLITNGSEGTIKIWDLRTQQLQQQINCQASTITLSDKGVLAAARGQNVTMWKDCLISDTRTPYLRYKASSMISDMAFIKHEDYLALSTFDSYEQTVVPESGEPFYDTYEQPEMQNKKQRLETNVRQLVEKLPPESISLQSNKIGTIDRASKTVIDKEQKVQLDEINSKKIIKQKKKMRGRNKIGKREKLKQSQKDEVQAKKWQGMLSDTLRIRRAEKEKRRQEIGLLGKLEKMPIKEFVKVVS